LNSPSAGNERLLDAMASVIAGQTLAARGPMRKAGVRFAHRRLAIVV
jgi:hypothetical protein